MMTMLKARLAPHVVCAVYIDLLSTLLVRVWFCLMCCYCCLFEQHFGYVLDLAVVTLCLSCEIQGGAKGTVNKHMKILYYAYKARSTHKTST